MGNDDDDAVAQRHGLRGSPRNSLVIALVVGNQLGVPAGRPAAAVGVVAVGLGKNVAVGQAGDRAVAGDGPGIESNAQAGTVAAQIAVAEASEQAISTGTGVSVAGTMPALRVPRTAGGPVELRQTVGRWREPRHEAAACSGTARMPALRGWAGGRPRTGRRGMLPGSLFIEWPKGQRTMPILACLGIDVEKHQPGIAMHQCGVNWCTESRRASCEIKRAVGVVLRHVSP